MRKNSGQKGQVLLIVLLVMVVGLTIGLSLATRSVTDIKISTQLEESSRAFSAAEAGIEAALKGETAPPSPVPIGNAFYTFSTTDAGGTTAPLPLGKIGIADTYTVWLVGHVDEETFDWGTTYTGISIDVCWDQGAMEVGVIYQQGGTYKIARRAYDPSSDRRTLNHFAPTDEGGCAGLTNKKNINFTDLGISGTLVALRLRPFYSDANMGVAPTSGAVLPSQGLNITSTGTAGDTTRKVIVVQSYPSLPAIFDYVLFSGTGVSK